MTAGKSLKKKTHDSAPATDPRVWFPSDTDLTGSWAIAQDVLVHGTSSAARAELAPPLDDVGDDISEIDELTNAAAPRAGTIVLGVSTGTLAANMSVPASSTWTMAVQDPADTGWLFRNEDICFIQAAKGGSAVTWFTVQRGVQSAGQQTYTCTFQSGKRPATYHTGNVVIDYGKSGAGYLVMSANMNGAPFYSVRTHAGTPWLMTSERARLGNMNGAFGISSDAYGMGIGDFAGEQYIRYDGSTMVMAVDALGIANSNPDTLLTIGDGTRTGAAPASEMFAVRQDVSSSPDHLAAVVLQNWVGTTGNSIQGVESYLTGNHASGTLGLALNFIANTQHRGGGAITTVRLYSGAFIIGDNTGNVSNVISFATAPVVRGATAVGTITNYYGLYLDAQPSTGITNRFAVYQLGRGDKNYFNGNIGLGTTNPGSALTFADAKDMAFGVTTGTRIGTSPTQKLGFWNKSPIAQPVDVGANNGTLAGVAAQANAIRNLLRNIGLMG